MYKLQLPLILTPVTAFNKIFSNFPREGGCPVENGALPIPRLCQAGCLCEAKGGGLFKDEQYRLFVLVKERFAGI